LSVVLDDHLVLAARSGSLVSWLEGERLFDGAVKGVGDVAQAGEAGGGIAAGFASGIIAGPEFFQRYATGAGGRPIRDDINRRVLALIDELVGRFPT